MRKKIGCAALLVAAFVVFVPMFVWYGCRVEPGNGEMAVLIKKTGKNLPSGEIIALSPEYKGVQLEPLGEGRYFYNPYSWDWKIMKLTDIPAGSFGVLVRKFGKELPHGEIIAADENSRGIVREVLGTGKHRINPYAYEVQVFHDIKIRPGNVGVVTSLCGKDIFSGAANDFKENLGFLVAPGSKGVQKEYLKEGTHRINPFLQSVSIVNIQSQRHEFGGEEAITFLSIDGFIISLEGTVEFNILPEFAAKLSHEVGDMDDILKKLILPSVRGFTRIEGSKKTSTEFIIGESRQKFQNALETFLKNNCQKWGISVNSVLIRDITPPQEIAEVIRKRELAKQEANKFKQQITQARSNAELAKQEMLAKQNRDLVSANTAKITAEIASEQAQMQQLIDAQTKLEVAEIGLKTARAEAEAKLKMAEADRQVIAEKNQAEAAVLARGASAFGGGEAYARARLNALMAQKITKIMVKQNEGGAFGLPLSGTRPASGK